MKRYLIKWLILVLAGILLTISAAAESVQAEWTVMFYFCGSDLESRHGYASENLGEIANCFTRAAISGMDTQNVPEYASEGVNVVIETGGCKEWHAQDLGMDIHAGAIQRWHYRPIDTILLDMDGNEDHSMKGTFDMEAELPAASMADPQTLSDFIRWSAAYYPAKKYALVLWGHGGGAISGLFIDEYYNNDRMYLDELRGALSDGGVEFETVLFDACLMASVETAYAVSDNAHWMVASEEVVAGKGTAVGEWLQQLYLTPQWDGGRLGRWICDMTQIKYANVVDERSQMMLTWSVIDLDKIGRFIELFDRAMELYGQIYAEKPSDFLFGFSRINETFSFALGDTDLYDIMWMLYQPDFSVSLDWDVYTEMLDALSEAVVYVVRGPDRSGALGLSFCAAAGFLPDMMEIYARNCPSAHYLAFLDAVSPDWSAPDWVYERAEHLPDITEDEEYEIVIEKQICDNGCPGLFIDRQQLMKVDTVRMNLYRLNDESGNTVCLGSIEASYESTPEGKRYYFDGFDIWPSVEGVHCNVQMVKTSKDDRELFNIPVRVGTSFHLLRMGYNGNAEEPLTIYGLWEGYEADSTVFGRNVMDLSQISGQEFCLLYPIDGTGRPQYEASEPLTFYRRLQITAEPLEPGAYYLEYSVDDFLSHSRPVDRAEVYWDGNELSVAGEPWEGMMELAAR